MADTENTTVPPDDETPDGEWILDGISPETRVAAEAAAEVEGTTLGAWLEAAIREAAGDSPDAISSDDILAAIDALSVRIASAERTTQHSIAPLRERLGKLSYQVTEIEEIAGTDLLAGDDEAGDADANDTISISDEPRD